MSKLTVSGRGVVAAVCVVTAAALAVTAMSTYIYQPMATDFGLDGQQASVVKAVPIMATILVVFLAGTLADRLGRRRITAWSCVAFSAGAAVAAVAPNAPIAVLGISVMSIGATTMSVTAVALLASTFTSKEDRANAFSIYGTITPAVFLVAPFLAGVIVTNLSWRLVAVLWVFIGVVALVLSRRMLPADETSPRRPELLTPFLAGLSLMLAVQITVSISDNGLMSLNTLLLTAATLIAFAVLFVVHRRSEDPQLTTRPLRNLRSWLLLFVVFTVPIVSLWYTTFLAFQYIYGLTETQIALIMVPAQLAGMLGARIMKPAIERFGLRTAGLAILGLLTVVQFGYLALSAGSLWLTAVLIALYGFGTTAFMVASSNAVMNQARPEDSGVMSSYRTASGRIGSALSSLIIGGILFGTYNLAMGDQETAAGYSTSTITSSQAAQFQTASMLDSVHARAVFAGVLTIVSAAAYAAALRRRRDEQLGS